MLPDRLLDQHGVGSGSTTSVFGHRNAVQHTCRIPVFSLLSGYKLGRIILGLFTSAEWTPTSYQIRRPRHKIDLTGCNSPTSSR